jgi:hypothetical protein
VSRGAAVVQVGSGASRRVMVTSGKASAYVVGGSIASAGGALGVGAVVVGRGVGGAGWRGGGLAQPAANAAATRGELRERIARGYNAAGRAGPESRAAGSPQPKPREKRAVGEAPDAGKRAPKAALTLRRRSAAKRR